MALTGEALLQQLSIRIGDWWSSTTTSAGADASTLTDTALQEFEAEFIEDSFIRVTQSGGNQYSVRKVSASVGANATMVPVLAGALGSGDTYEMHRFHPDAKFRALDAARVLAYPQLSIIRFDETVTGDGENAEIVIPSTIRKGPVEVWEEDLLGPTAGWNALTDPQMNTLSSAWTAAGAAASLQTRTDFDFDVPRHETSCVRLAGSGTYSQVVGDMRSGMTAALAAGRRVTFGAWVYQRASSGTATVGITHDSTRVASSTHQGRGWEFLEVTATLPATNATTLTVDITTGGAVTVYAEWSYLALGERIPVKYGTRLSRRGIWRDDTNSEIRLIRPPRRGHQLRLIGHDPLSALGDTRASQGTNTMEVDEFTARLLVAKAARILLLTEGWTAGRIEEAFPFIQEVESEFAELEPDWSYDYPHEMKLEGWWSLE
jgi:hypothetical protein